MTIQIWIIFGILIATLTLFIIGRWRYDIVAILALLAVIFGGLSPIDRAFIGFSNPAVITVAAVLVVSRGLQNSGIVDEIGKLLLRLKGGLLIQMAALTGIVTVLSAFMNNVGALALLLPVAINISRKKNISPSVFLMPIAFAAHFGGMITLIGTPPNLLVSAFRQQALSQPFGMFDFAPVGLGVALAGLLFIIFIGWRLLPTRKGNSDAGELFQVEKYITEVRLPETCSLVGSHISDIGKLTENQVIIVALVRAGERRLSPPPQTRLLTDDILIMRIDTESLEDLVTGSGVELVGSKKIGKEDLESDDIALLEVVITPNSLMVNGTAYSLNLRQRFGVNLLAISRQGRRLSARMDRIRFRIGDVLLIQCRVNTVKEVLATLGCLPLAQRELRIGQPRRMILALIIFLAAIILSALGIIPVQVAFLATALLMVLTKLVSLHQAYDSIDWPIILLLGAMIPVGEALETTGGAALIANSLLSIAHLISPVIMLAIILLVTMTLSDIVNNAAAVVLMAPIAISIANGLGVSVDPFFMAIVIGGSSAFLTPIGHQSNTLVMGPGGYKFGDYWRMGIILELVIVVVAIPLITLFWKF